jgi:hypothetical protein
MAGGRCARNTNGKSVDDALVMHGWRLGLASALGEGVYAVLPMHRSSSDAHRLVIESTTKEDEMYETFPDSVRVEAEYRQAHLGQEFRHAGGHRVHHRSEGPSRHWLHRRSAVESA